MTQQEQQEFRESLEAALSWMTVVQEQLRVNDNTQGPRDALEARLRETEKIHASEHEGRVLVDTVLVAADVLLQGGDLEQKVDTNAKLKDLKAQWEETSTYIIHCHSRIEWVWLHWSEYLKAQQEFELWLSRLSAKMEAEVELQLGAQEKLWQADHQRVLQSDVCGQASLLERLLDEASVLHGRTQDPSVAPSAQEGLRQAYNELRDRAEERLLLLQKMAEQHQMYLGCVQKFHTWLLSKTKELADVLEEEQERPPEERLRALQALEEGVAGEEMTLQHIEGVAEAVRVHTSPAGAERVAREAEELRAGWRRLQQDLQVAAAGLRSGLDAHSQYLARRRRLGEDIGRLQVLLQGLGQELEEGRHTGGHGGREERNEEQLEGQWRKFTGVRDSLRSEDDQVEHLKAQLKELFRFSEDSRHLSDDVLAVVKEHQSVKSRAARLCSESEAGLRQVLQDPLHLFSQWTNNVSQVLESSAEVTDFSHIAMLVQTIERLLQHSVQLQERLRLLQAKSHLLAPVFGAERAEGLGTELSAATRNRELLHAQLLQRKSRLQALISRTNQFSDAYELLSCRLKELQDRLAQSCSLQPDILAKKSRAHQLGVLQKDLEDLEANILALETLVSSSTSNRTRYERLYAGWRLLYREVQVKVGESEEAIVEHESFQESLLSVEKWLMVMRQKLESFCSPSGGWSLENRQHEAERALGEFPEKEMQLHLMEAQGLRVLEHTSEEGRVHILGDVKRLREAWIALHDLSLNLYRLLNTSTEELVPDRWRAEGQPGEDMGVPFRVQFSVRGGYTQASAGAPGSNHGEGFPDDMPGEGHGPWLLEGRPPGREMNLQGEDQMDVGMQVHQGHHHEAAHLSQSTPVGMQVHQGHHHEAAHLSQSTPALGAEEAQTLSLATQPTLSRVGGTDQIDSTGVPTPGMALLSGASVLSGSGLAVADWTGDRRSPRAESTVGTKVGYERGQGGPTCSPNTVVAETGRRIGAAGGLGQGGGAFTLFRRDSARLQSSPPQSSPPGSGAALWESDPSTTVGLLQAVGPAEQEVRRRGFEAWLSGEQRLLSGLLSTKGATLGPKELKIRKDKLQALRAGVGWGQEQFMLLIQGSKRAGMGAGVDGPCGPEPPEDAGLEDLRYRWMLYKSKLKEVRDIRARPNIKGERATKEESVLAKKPLKQQKSGGLLQRVCWVALPLWILLLLLLLLPLLLPFMDNSNSCSLTNNFARSFNIMLRYDGPPPT